jgi:hypothetical protein
VSPEAIAALVGFDPWLCARLPAPVLTALVRRAEATLFACLLLAVALAHGALLAAGSALFALGMLVGALVLLVNLVRLVTAGGGAPFEAVHPTPSFGPLPWLAVLGAIAAQPAQLLVRGLGAPGELAAALGQLWHAPWSAGWGTLAFLVVALGPALVAQLGATPALAAYESLRRRRDRALVSLDDARTRRSVAELLARHPGARR